MIGTQVSTDAAVSSFSIGNNSNVFQASLVSITGDNSLRETGPFGT